MFKKNRSYAYSSAIVLVLSAILQIYSATSLHESVEIAVSRPLAFFLRSKFVQEDLDPRIKIFSMDDRSVSGLGVLDLDLPSWATVINAVSARQPKAVFIDKLFDKIYSPEEIATFNTIAKGWQTPVYPIVFVYPGKIPFRQSVSTLRLPANFPSLRLDQRPTSKTAELSLYGAVPDLLATFESAGHTVYNGDGKGVLFYQAGDGVVVPHLGLLAADTLSVGGDVVVNGNVAFADKNLEFIVNFLPKDRFLKRSFSFLEVVTAARNQKSITPVRPGDFVFILPAMYTGHTDWRETPFGSMPGGYYGISVFNSVLTGNWIRNVKDPGFAVLIVSFFLILIGYRSTTTKLISYTGLLVTVVLLGSFLLFAYANTLVFWFTLTSSMILNLIVLVVGLNQDASLEKVRLDSELATAKIVHHTFFPPITIASPHLDLSSFYESSTECGGDWWMHDATTPDVEYVLIGDAVGHGVPAALVASVAYAVNSTMAQLKKSERLAMPGPKEFLEILGSVLVSMKSRNAVMTFQVAKFDFVAGTMELANAGHTFPIIVPKAADDDRLKPGKRSLAVRLSGNPLGIALDTPLKVKITALRPGDRIIFYSDGMIENRGGKDRQPLKIAGLTSIIESSAHQNSDVMKTEILKSYLSHVGKLARDDDATLVVVSYR